MQQTDFRNIAYVAWEASRAAAIQGAIATDPGTWNSLTPTQQDAQVANVVALASGSRIQASEALATIKSTATTKLQEAIDWVAVSCLRAGR